MIPRSHSVPKGKSFGPTKVIASTIDDPPPYRTQGNPRNAHHLRELQYILEQYGQPWALQMSWLLGAIHSWVEGLKAAGERALPTADLAAREARYQAILGEGFAANPLPGPVKTRVKKRGRSKRSPPRNLLERLQKHQEAVLAFMRDFRLPFDNN